MKFPKIRFGIVAGSTIAGAATGFLSGTPGHRTDYAKEGALMGLGVGGGVVIAPSLAKLAGRQSKAAFKKGAAAATAKGRVIFKRIRGRIIPIRVK